MISRCANKEIWRSFASIDEDILPGQSIRNQGSGNIVNGFPDFKIHEIKERLADYEPFQYSEYLYVMSI